jgi:hypothetical protein
VSSIEPPFTTRLVLERGDVNVAPGRQLEQGAAVS